MKKHSVGVVVVAIFMAFAMSGCGGGTDAEPKKNGSEASEKPRENIDPSKGWVKLPITQKRDRFEVISVQKYCDGDNLVYVSETQYSDNEGGISVIPDSNQCRRR